jgi:hypothetical protein
MTRLPFLDQTHRNTGYGCLRTPVHHGQGATTNGCYEEEPLDSVISTTRTVELLRRQNRLQCTLQFTALGFHDDRLRDRQLHPPVRRGKL